MFTDSLVSNIVTQIWNHALKLKILHLFNKSYKWAQEAFSFVVVLSDDHLKSSYEDVILPEIQELSYCVINLF